jgi:hypothetical protein
MKYKLTILTALLGLSLFGCGPDLRSDHAYQCGLQLTEAELAQYVPKGKPQYNFGELKLLGKISSILFEENGKAKNYDVQFWNSDANSLVVQVYGLTDAAAIDHSTCKVFAFKDYIFPKETVLLFYQGEKSAPKPEIVVGLRKK